MKDVLCDVQLIRSHLQNAHKLGIPSYKALASSSNAPIEYDQEKKQRICHGIVNATSYQCTECQTSFPSLLALKSHFEESSCKQEYGKGLTEYADEDAKVLHPCRKCGLLLMCDVYVIFKHVSNRHRMKLESYLDLDHFEGEAVDKSEFASWSRNSFIHDPLPDQQVLESQGIYPKGCTFKCMDCDFESDTYRNLRYHAKESKCYLAAEKETVVKKKHKCKSCGKNLLASIERVRLHVYRKHKVIFSEYCGLESVIDGTNNEDEGNFLMHSKLDFTFIGSVIEAT